MSSEVENRMDVADAGSSVNAELTEEQAGALERMFSAELVSTVSTDKVIVMDELDIPQPEPEPEIEPEPGPIDEPEPEPGTEPDTDTEPNPDTEEESEEDQSE